MEGTTTRERILRAALELFAQSGYEAVTVAQIAGAVGIRAPSLYKHFRSKQDIFDAILREMETRYQAQMAALHMDGLNPAADAGTLARADVQALIAIARGLFHYYLHDEFAAPFRRMLAVEQFHNPRLGELYARQYVEDPLAFQGALFGLLMQGGHLRAGDATAMALHFYAPVFLLLTLCDSQPDQEPEALRMLERSIQEFLRTYQVENGGQPPENGGSL